MTSAHSPVDRALAIAFKNEHLSVSRLKLYEQCALSFYYRYIDKGPTAPRGEAADFGTVLHAALEAFFAWVVDQEFAGILPVDQLLAFYQEAWTASKLTGVALYQEGVSILRAYAKANDTVDHMCILAVEREFNIDVGGYTVNGYIDRVDKIADDHIAIIDYKSNRLLFSKAELDTDLQMSIYGLAARVLWPWAKQVSFVFHMLRHNVKQSAERDAATIDDAAGYVQALGECTETSEEFPPTLNSNCGYCDHRARCASYKEAIRGESMILKATDMTDLTQVATEREQVARLAKMMYARKEELDALIKRKMQETGDLTAAGYSYAFQHQYHTSYPLDPVVRAFVNAGLDEDKVKQQIVVTGVDKDKVEELRIETARGVDRPRALLLKATLEALAIKTPMTPKLMSQAVKGAKKPDGPGAEKSSVAPKGRGTRAS